MRVDLCKCSFSNQKCLRQIAHNYAWREVWEVEISKWNPQYTVYFYSLTKNNEKGERPNLQTTLEQLPKEDWICAVQTSEGYYILHTKVLARSGAVERDDYSLFKALQQNKVENFRLYLNASWQHEVGYILDAIIYVDNQDDKVFTINT